MMRNVHPINPQHDKSTLKHQGDSASLPEQTVSISRIGGAAIPEGKSRDSLSGNKPAANSGNSIDSNSRSSTAAIPKNNTTSNSRVGSSAISRGNATAGSRSRATMISGRGITVLPEGKALDLLSHEELLKRLIRLDERERKITLSLLLHLAEIDRRELYLGLGYCSLFEFCRGHLRYSEATAGRRIAVARMIGKYPVVYRKLETGELNVTTVARISGIVTPENLEGVLEQVKGRSSREVERVISRYRPGGIVRDKIRPVSTRISFRRLGEGNDRDRMGNDDNRDPLGGNNNRDLVGNEINQDNIIGEKSTLSADMTSSVNR